jgi:hypothetical protein
MKCVQVFWSRGREDDRVKSWITIVSICILSIAWFAYLNIRRRYVTNNIGMIVYHNQRRDTLAIHQLESFTEGFIAAGRKKKISIVLF